MAILELWNNSLPSFPTKGTQLLLTDGEKWRQKHKYLYRQLNLHLDSLRYLDMLCALVEKILSHSPGISRIDCIVQLINSHNFLGLVGEQFIRGYSWTCCL